MNDVLFLVCEGMEANIGNINGILLLSFSLTQEDKYRLCLVC